MKQEAEVEKLMQENLKLCLEVVAAKDKNQADSQVRSFTVYNYAFRIRIFAGSSVVT